MDFALELQLLKRMQASITEQLLMLTERQVAYQQAGIEMNHIFCGNKPLVIQLQNLFSEFLSDARLYDGRRILRLIGVLRKSIQLRLSRFDLLAKFPDSIGIPAAHGMCD